ncbi:MAG: CpsD/CapB family tyrosine-protein kinase [Coprococcus sp.]
MRKINVEFQDMPYAIEEAMNRLRINIKFCGKNTKKILITSSMPNEGKSTIATNLWKMMAEAGFPTVLVDVDLRKSILKERLNISSSGDIKDLGYYLSGLAEYEDVVYETNIKNGYMVPCTNLLENPSALLEDARFRELLDRLAENYRYVIIDSPPLGSVSDGALVASMCDGAVLVVRGGETPKSVIRQSFQQIEQVNCKLLGVVLNRVETTGRAYKKYYGKYNGYYNEYHYGKEAAASENKG